jgi:hypothetical protein
MSAEKQQDMSPDDVMNTYGDASKQFNVRSRGRPERSPRENAITALRRKAFGERMRALREAAELTPVQAANLAGISSPRKLTQYESVCYPPGEIVVRLAEHYMVDPQAICELVLQHSDPDLYEGLTGRPGYTPTDHQIDEYLTLKSSQKN